MEVERRTVFKSKSPERLAAEQAERDRKAAERELKDFLASPVGQARTAFERGDHVFQYSHSVMSQKAEIIAMVGGKVHAYSNDPSEILNAVCGEGWELVNGSFVFVEMGQLSRDKFMSSGQQVAVQGQTVGYYLFRRCEASQQCLDR